MEARAGVNMTLTCTVLDGRPRATVVWTRRGQVYTGSHVVEEEQEASSEAMVAEGRTTVVSTLVMTPQAADNGVEYQCEGKHPALGPEGLSESLRLEVLSPPARPVIRVVGRTQGEVLRAGQEVTLRCVSHGGNPLAQLHWFRDGEKIDTTYQTEEGRRAINDYTFTVVEDDNSAVFKCEASSPGLAQPLTEQLKLTVEFAPSKVAITGPETGELGEEYTFECSSGNSNPAASLRWIVDRRTVAANFTVTEESDNGGFVTKSNISLTVLDSTRYKMVNCYANNAALGGAEFHASHRLTVVYPPDALMISGYRKREVLLEGAVTKIKCTVMTGNPLPKLVWFRETEEVAEQTSTEVLDEDKNKLSVSTEITINVDRHENEKTYKCKAKVEGKDKFFKNLTSKAKVKLKVNFLTESLVLAVSPDKLVEKQIANVTCSTRPSNPAVDIIWRYNEKLLAADGTNSRKADGKDDTYGGFVTSSFLLIALTDTHVDGKVWCEARHNYTNTAIHDSIDLDVEYSPKFTSVPDQPVVVEVGRLLLSWLCSLNYSFNFSLK